MKATRMSGPVSAGLSRRLPEQKLTKKDLTRFKKVLEAQRQSQLFNDRVLREDFNVNSDDHFDEIDQAATDSEQSMRMRLRNREVFVIKKIDEALQRLEDGTFGECEDCGEQIGLRRLEARPITTLCIACKEGQERKESLNASGRQHKSLGETFSRRYA